MWSSEHALPRQILAALLALAALALAHAGDARAQAASPTQALAIVSARNGGITVLDRASAEQIYLGRRSTLPDGRAVTLVDLPAGPARDQFYLLLTRKNPSQIRAYWSRLVFTGRAQPPREAADADDVRRILQATPGAIAYLPLDAAQDPGLIILLTLD
jgi:ABC-type phosphate transport system substrate-binding protein